MIGGGYSVVTHSLLQLIAVRTAAVRTAKTYTFILKYKQMCESLDSARDKLHEHNLNLENHQCALWQRIRESNPCFQDENLVS